MESVERFSQNELIIEEYVSQWLVPISSDFGRLADVALLRDVTSGRYHHPALEEVYPADSVHQALLYCHEELFQRLVEIPLERQEWDLRVCFAAMPAPVGQIAFRWLELEHFRSLVPLGAPPYLRDLFLANTRSILSLIVREQAAMAATA